MTCEEFGNQACVENDRAADKIGLMLDEDDPIKAAEAIRTELYDRPPSLAIDLIDRIQHYDQQGKGADLLVDPIIRREPNSWGGYRYLDTGDREVVVQSQYGRDQVAVLRGAPPQHYEQYPERHHVDPFMAITSMLVGGLLNGEFSQWRHQPRRNHWQDRRGGMWYPQGGSWQMRNAYGYDGYGQDQSYFHGGHRNNDYWRMRRQMMGQPGWNMAPQTQMPDWMRRRMQNPQGQLPDQHRGRGGVVFPDHGDHGRRDGRRETPPWQGQNPGRIPIPGHGQEPHRPWHGRGPHDRTPQPGQDGRIRIPQDPIQDHRGRGRGQGDQRQHIQIPEHVQRPPRQGDQRQHIQIPEHVQRPPRQGDGRQQRPDVVTPRVQPRENPHRNQQQPVVKPEDRRRQR